MTKLFTQALESLPQFVSEMNPDWGMVYDYMIQQSEQEELTEEQILKVTDVYDDVMGYN
jgi:hypothetical protein|tara:strand:- start:32 stop:208 length:177 start_codon:yes stop_codon:yes gene_type:complete